MGNDTIKKTLIVAGLLSIVCSVVVSGAAVFLRSDQLRNKDLDKKKNILMAAGLLEKGKSVEELFAKFEAKLVDLATGEYHEDIDIATFDQRKDGESQEYGIPISKRLDLAGIKNRSKYALVYIARDEEGLLQQMILPVHGKGLRSTLYGFLALDRELTTLNGCAFSEHGETPGLGGDADNPRGKAQWTGKQACDQNCNIATGVAKANSVPNHLQSRSRVDGLP